MKGRNVLHSIVDARYSSWVPFTCFCAPPALMDDFELRSTYFCLRIRLGEVPSKS